MTKTTEPTRVSLQYKGIYLVDVLRYPASIVAGVHTVTLMLVGGKDDRATVAKLARGLYSPGLNFYGIWVDGTHNVFITGETKRKAEHGADEFLTRLQRALEQHIASS